jgi:hypothetical protein
MISALSVTNFAPSEARQTGGKVRHTPLSDARIHIRDIRAFSDPDAGTI